MSEKSLRNTIILLFLVTVIAAAAANYPTYYVMYHSGISAFFTGIPITQYSIRMSFLVFVAVISSLLNLYLIKRYYMRTEPKKSIRRYVLLSAAIIVLALMLNYPSYYAVYYHGLRSFFEGVIITQYSYRATAILALLLVFLVASFVTFIRQTAAKVVTAEREITQKKPELSDSELLRVKMWRARAQNSRLLGLIMLILSAALFLLSYETLAIVYEVGSLAAFVIGAALILTQLDPKVKLYPASDTSLGPLLALAEMLRGRYGMFSVTFESTDEGDKMVVTPKGNTETMQLSLEPIGEGLVRSYERELGELNGKGEDYIESWLTKTLSQGLGLVESAKIVFIDGEMQSTLQKPFVRTLCVQQEMTEHVCNTMGCPLIASLGQSAAKATGKKISHIECKYDPSTQRVVSRHKMED
ncbi:MAG: hypothetical protein QXV32_03775 [Conexivisphaerales archaeon]